MNIIQESTKNYSSRYGHIPDIIVDHITGGSNVSSAINEFKYNDRASSHFLIDDDTGNIDQFVDIRNAAWGNGTSDKPDDLRYYGRSTLAAVRERKVNANLYTISIEHVNAGGGILTQKQLASSIALHKFIISEVKRIYGIDIPVDREHIVGHYQINPVTKPNCPGAHFPFDKIIAGIRGTNVAFRSDTTAPVAIAHGGSYIAKFTYCSMPLITFGTPGVAEFSLVSQSGNDYFVRFTAIGASGTGTGVFVNGNRIFIINVK